MDVATLTSIVVIIYQTCIVNCMPLFALYGDILMGQGLPSDHIWSLAFQCEPQDLNLIQAWHWMTVARSWMQRPAGPILTDLPNQMGLWRNLVPSLGDHEKSQVGPLLGLVWGLVSGLVVGGLWAALVFISLVEVIDHRPTSSGSTNGHIPSDEFNGLIMRSLFCPSGPAQVIMGSLGL